MTSPWFGTFTLTDHPTNTDIIITAPAWHEDELLFRVAMLREERMDKVVRVWRDGDLPRLIGGWVPRATKEMVKQ